MGPISRCDACRVHDGGDGGNRPGTGVPASFSRAQLRFARTRQIGMANHHPAKTPVQIPAGAQGLRPGVHGKAESYG